MPAGSLNDMHRRAVLSGAPCLSAEHEETFERFTRVAVRALRTPLAFLSLMGGERLFFSGTEGCSVSCETLRDTPLFLAYGKTIVTTGQSLVLENSRQGPSPTTHERDLGLVAYVGVPLTTRDGHVVGALCGCDSKPREWERGDIEVLSDLAAAVVSELEHRTTAHVAEKVLEASAELDAFFSNLPMGLALVDRSLRFRRINQQLAEMNGASIEGHLGKTISEVLPELSRDVLEGVYRRVLDHGETLHDQELAGETPASPGELREWRASYFPVRNAAGEVSGVGSAIKEITQQRRIERERTHANALLHDLLENVPLMVFVLDADGRYLLANKAGAASLGLSPAELVGRLATELLPASVAQEILEADDAIRRRKASDVLEQGLVRDGQLRHFRVVKFPVGREHGYPDAVASVVLDVTEQVLTQMRMSALARLGGVLAAHVDARIAFQDIADLVVPEFADWCSLFVRSESGQIELAGQRHVDPSVNEMIARMHEKYPFRDDAPSGHRAVFRTGKPQLIHDLSVARLRTIAIDEEHFHMLESLAALSCMLIPVFVEDTVFGVLGMFTSTTSGRRYTSEDVSFVSEITARLGVTLEGDRLRSERETVLTRLEQHVVERTAELERRNEALAASRREAERANATKSEFLARMSHELRTPLNGVLGMATLLLESSLGAEQREMLQTLRGSADSLLTILNEILDFSKIETGKVQLELQPFHLRSCIKDAADLFVGAAAQKNISLSLTIADDVPSAVEGDPTRLRQVLTNLLGNALKFTERGGVSLTVRRENDTEILANDALLRFEIRDTGIGIPMEQKENLFSPFSQGHVSTTRLYGGTGLGLSIVKHLVELMDGRIEFDSVLGAGTVFRIFLSFKITSLERPSSDSAATFDASMGIRSPLRILLVEDNSVNQKVAKRMLALFGYSADLASNGAEAVKSIADRPYEVIFMDVHMPVLDGLEATREIRTMTLPWAQPRIVAMTASMFDSDRNSCTAAGMDDFVTKPVRPGELEGALRRATEALLRSS